MPTMILESDARITMEAVTAHKSKKKQHSTFPGVCFVFPEVWVNLRCTRVKSRENRTFPKNSATNLLNLTGSCGSELHIRPGCQRKKGKSKKKHCTFPNDNDQKLIPPGVETGSCGSDPRIRTAVLWNLFICQLPKKEGKRIANVSSTARSC